MCAKNISDIHSEHFGIVCCAVPHGIKGKKEGKPGFRSMHILYHMYYQHQQTCNCHHTNWL